MSTVVKGNGPAKKRKDDKRTRYVCSDGTTIDMVSLTKKQDTSKFFVDAQHLLLYWINADGTETLCVPDVVNASGESIRYHLFMEMHDSPFYGQCGLTSSSKTDGKFG
jgi:membrane-bound inhibitor of C-type lysozyme